MRVEVCDHNSECALLYGDGPDAPSFCECKRCCQRRKGEDSGHER